VVFLAAFLERGDRFWSLKIVTGRKRSKVAAGDALDAGSGLYKHLREVHIVPMRLLLLLFFFFVSLSLSRCFKELLAATAPRFVCGQ
jgi:thiosulfate reductase cytochrome b subunit